MQKLFAVVYLQAVVSALFAVSFLAQRSLAQDLPIKKIPAAIVIQRVVTGSYSQHAVVFQQLMEYVGKNYLAVGACFGIYPQDPDATGAKAVTWKVGVRVISGEPRGYGNNLPLEKLPKQSDAELRRILREMKTPETPYELEIIPETSAVVKESTVAKAGQDGLDLIPWMARNGYVQTGPTRMEYLSHEGPPTALRVSIIVPVKKRERNLKSSN